MSLEVDNAIETGNWHPVAEVINTLVLADGWGILGGLATELSTRNIIAPKEAFLGYALVEAARAQQWETAELLVNAGAPIDSRDRGDNWTPLMFAARYN